MSFADFKARLLENPEIRTEYDSLAAEFTGIDFGRTTRQFDGRWYVLIHKGQKSRAHLELELEYYRLRYIKENGLWSLYGLPLDQKKLTPTQVVNQKRYIF